MRISKANKNYFYFSLSDDDFQKNYLSCKRFLNAFQKDFSGGKNGDRFWLKKIKAWAIRNSCRQQFRLLLEKYFDLEKQEDIFDD